MWFPEGWYFYDFLALEFVLVVLFCVLICWFQPCLQGWFKGVVFTFALFAHWLGVVLIVGLNCNLRPD